MLPDLTECRIDFEDYVANLFVAAMLEFSRGTSTFHRTGFDPMSLSIQASDPETDGSSPACAKSNLHQVRGPDPPPQLGAKKWPGGGGTGSGAYESRKYGLYRW